MSMVEETSEDMNMFDIRAYHLGIMDINTGLRILKWMSTHVHGRPYLDSVPILEILTKYFIGSPIVNVKWKLGYTSRLGLKNLDVELRGTYK